MSASDATHTLYALIDGAVKFEQARRDKKRASVYPLS